ncbi:chloride channel protein [Archaeoglobales archaeon]|nr:MAG: chloride channel protein [Archaeoglobales archaeon]
MKSILRIRNAFRIGYLWKWNLIGITVGIIAGFGAIIFYTLLEYSTYLFLGLGAGFFPPRSGIAEQSWIAPENPLMVIAVITLGGLACGLLVYSFAPEAEGHGTDAAIKAFHKEGGKVRARIPLIKTIASAITIGSGGSAGREGPTAQISAGYGSIAADLLKLDPRDRRLALAVGIGAGIGSIFKAPLGGAILGTEILYKRDFEVEALMPGLIASVIGYVIFCTYDGYKPVFMFPEVHISAFQIPFFMLEGIICGVFGLVYVFSFYKTHDLFSRIFNRTGLPQHLKPAVGAFITGIVVVLVAYLFNPAAGYGALGMGYGFLQLAMFNLIPLEVMLVLAIVKIIATSLTIGSGGSGGVFAPGLVIGGMIGGAIGLLFHLLFPSIIPIDVVPAFVAIGMIALFGGISKAPISVLIMISEMTKNYELLFPGMAAVALAYMITGDHTIYIEQVNTKADSPAHREEMSVDILQNIEVREAMIPAERILTVSPDNTIPEILDLIEKTGHVGFPVLEDGRLVGIITFQDAGRVPSEDRSKTKVADVMSRDIVVVYPDENLEEALIKLIQKDIGRLPVVERHNEKKLVGLITRSDIMKAHAREVVRVTE